MNLKKTNAVARRERFKTGGGPPERPETYDLGDLLTSIIDSQQPLEGIPDDDHLDREYQGICIVVSHFLQSYNQKYFMNFTFKYILFTNAAI